jgi:hypothetical protein
LWPLIPMSPEKEKSSLGVNLSQCYYLYLYIVVILLYIAPITENTAIFSLLNQF